MRPYHPPAQPPPQARKWLDKPNAEVFRIGTQASVPKTPALVKAASITANAFYAFANAHSCRYPLTDAACPFFTSLTFVSSLRSEIKVDYRLQK